MSVMDMKPKKMAITQYYNGCPTLSSHYKVVEAVEAEAEVQRLSAIFPGHTFRSNPFSGS